MPLEWWEEDTTTGRWRPVGVRKVSCKEVKISEPVTRPHLQHSSNNMQDTNINTYTYIAAVQGVRISGIIHMELIFVYFRSQVETAKIKTAKFLITANN